MAQPIIIKNATVVVSAVRAMAVAIMRLNPMLRTIWVAAIMLAFNNARAAQALTVEDYLKNAEVAMNHADYATAITNLDQVINLSPNNAGAYFARGDAKQGTGDLKGSIADLTKAIDLNFGISQAFQNRGYAEIKIGDYDAAISDLSKVIELSPQNSNAYFERGDTKMIKGDFDGALADCKLLVKLDPAYYPAYMDMACMKQVRGDFEGAIADYKDSLQWSRPGVDDSRLYFNLVLKRLHRDESEADLASSITKWADGWYKDIGRYLTGDLPEKAFLDEAAKDDGKAEPHRQCQAFYFVGMTHLVKGDKSGAQAFFQKCFDTNLKPDMNLILARAELGRLATKN